MVRIRCRTNLDGYETVEWPDALPAVPQVGQWIQAKSRKRLRVASLTWLYTGELEVELHL